MSHEGTCVWIGASSARYTYYVYRLPANFTPGQDGNYVYARTDARGDWVPVYVGQGDLNDRSGPGHHQAPCIAGKRATHFHAHLNRDKGARLAEEGDLLRAHPAAQQPVGCNERY